MGLETFDFIPDLVDTNPEPTDPVAQGDDHIRGLKFTLQNQWPVIGDNQVLRTALQMNDAALRSEANIFTQRNTFQDTLLEQQATSDAQNAYKQFLDENGFVRWAHGRASTVGGGVGRYAINRHDAAGVVLDTVLAFDAAEGKALFANDVSFSAQILGADGSAAAPSHAFTNSENIGMYREGNALSFATLGVRRLRMESGQMLQGNDGTPTLPAFSFENDAGLGMYRETNNVLGWATSGAERLRLSQSSLTVRSLQIFADSQQPANAPSYSFQADTDTGLYRSAGDAIGLATGGLAAIEINSIQTCTLRKENTITRLDDDQARTGWRYTNNAGQPQWAIYLGTQPSNVLSFQRYSSTGTFLDIPFQLNQERGTVRMPTLPTSNVGLVAGDCWRNPVSPGFVAIV